MKFLKLVFISVAGTGLIFVGCSTPSIRSNNAVVERQSYRAVGVIRRIDIDTDRVTIDHDDIPGYMSAMEMTEMVSDHELLGGIQVGDKVEFDILRTGSSIVFTGFRKIGTVAVVDGGEIYKVNCAECHGGSGEGSKKGIPLVKGHALHHSEAEHLKQVSDGEGSKMPAFRDNLTAEQVAAVVQFVRQEIQKNPTRDPSQKHKH